MPKHHPLDEGTRTLLHSLIEILREEGLAANIEKDLQTGIFFILAKTKETGIRATAIVLQDTRIRMLHRTNFINEVIHLTPEDLADPEVFKKVTDKIKAQDQ